MDRLAQTALSAIRQMQDNKFDLANNLANVNVPGFRKDLPNEGNAGFLKELEKENEVVSLEQIARKPVFASQEKMVSSLLKEMKGRKTHMAMVVDEHGGVEGLVTLEDLLEEIVGEIEDETDLTREKGYERIDQDTIITNGDIEIDLINEIFTKKIPEGDDYATLNGLLHERLQDIPQEGDKIELEELRIVVEKVSKNIPQKIRIERIRN